MLEIFRSFWIVFVAVIYILGVIAALEAIWKGRTAQGSIAWVISLIIFPYLALPLYWIFGDRKFYGYVSARRSGDLKINHIANDLTENLRNKNLVMQQDSSEFRVMEYLAGMPFTTQNNANLLINGNVAFKEIFSSIESAQDYILIQFYMILNDNLGNQLKELLIKKTYQGVRIFVLYDEIGSYKLSKQYVEELRDKGVQIYSFKTHKRLKYRFRLNFRNHRKIVIIDGKTAFVGGMNVGDKYLGIHPKFGFWRDTQIKIEGPAVQCIQVPFITDWYWVTKKVPDLSWTQRLPAAGTNNILALPSGPADENETCGMFFVHIINSATKRLWIVSPYFVPDQPVLNALQLAAMRGVDVKLIIPAKSDLLLTYLSSFSYLKEITDTGVEVYRYQKGYLHQKVMLIDDKLSVVGTANLDNRSFRINFEINIISYDSDFAVSVEQMLQKDLEDSIQVDETDYSKRPLWFKLAVKSSRLLAPIQ
ncbi:MAG: cardiolipin synthase [Candidatus Cloacimonadota bacterium]|nr:MAG: cardiolipin synthase [Candidatus Cloacimonadota bacterium]RLC53622.1 MAG: cardiolipin synthase [Candidatus Cloacimonadota bacterium]